MADKQFISFNVGDNLFGIDILVVREINRNLNITPIDLAPDFVRGLINLRGQIVTVLDLSARLGLGVSVPQASSSCVILKTENEFLRSHASGTFDVTLNQHSVGLFVDSIGDVISVPESDIDSPSRSASDVSARFISGVVRLNKNLLVTLNPTEVLAMEMANAESF